MSTNLSPKQKFELLIDKIEDNLNDRVKRVVTNECKMEDECRLNPLRIAREAFSQANIYGGSFNTAHESSILLEFFTGEGTKDYIIRRFYMCIYNEMITWQTFDKELLLRILNVDARTIDSRFMKYFNCTAAEAYKRYNYNKISLAKPKLRWEDLSKTAQDNFDRKEDEAINTSGRYGVDDEAFKTAKLAEDLQAFYGLNDAEGAAAFYIFKTYKYPIEDCFQYVYEHVWTFIPGESKTSMALREQLPEYLRSRDTVFLFFEVKLNPEDALAARRNHAKGRLKLDQSKPLHEYDKQVVKEAISSYNEYLHSEPMQYEPYDEDLQCGLDDEALQCGLYNEELDILYDKDCFVDWSMDKEQKLIDWDEFAYVKGSSKLKESLSEDEQKNYGYLRRYKALRIFSLLGESDVLMKYHDWLRSVDLDNTDYLAEHPSLFGEKLEEIVHSAGLFDMVNSIITEAPALDFKVSDLAEEIVDATFHYNQRAQRVAFLVMSALRKSGIIKELRRQLYMQYRVDFTEVQPTIEQVIAALRTIVKRKNLDTEIKMIISPLPFDLSCFAYDILSGLKKRKVSPLDPNEGFKYVSCDDWDYEDDDHWGITLSGDFIPGFARFISLETGEMIKKEYILYDDIAVL